MYYPKLEHRTFGFVPHKLQNHPTEEEIVLTQPTYAGMDGYGVANGDAYDNVGRYLEDTESPMFGFGS